MSVLGDINGALATLGKFRLKGRFVFRSYNPSGGWLGAVFGGGALFVLPVNPQRFRMERPTRGSIQQTEGGAYEDDFNLGISTGFIRGTFGFQARPQIGSGGLPLLGMDHLNLLQDLITGFYTTARSVKATTGAVWEFYDLADLYFMRVRIDDFAVDRVVNEPMLHFYELRFSVLEDYLSAGAAIPRLPTDMIPAGGGTVGSIISMVKSQLGGLI